MLRTLPKPVIARITGWCLGGALTVAAGCDVAMASEDALFGLPEVNFGHFPAGETTAVLTEHLQPKHGLFYALSGKDDDRARSGASRAHFQSCVARGPRQGSHGVCPVSRGEESDGAEGREG